MPGKTHLQNDLLRIEWDVKPYSLTQKPMVVHGSKPRLDKFISQPLYITEQITVIEVQSESFGLITQRHH